MGWLLCVWFGRHAWIVPNQVGYNWDLNNPFHLRQCDRCHHQEIVMEPKAFDRRRVLTRQ